MAAHKRDRLNFLAVIASICLITFSSNLASAAGAAASPPLTVFFIHGYGGNAGSFCDLPAILEKQAVGTGTTIKSEVLVYDTKDKILAVHHFVGDIQKQIANYFAKHGLKPDSPYSIVAHSQGGIIGLKYIERCLMGKKCENTPTNIQHFITLGTPFWGSPTAAKMKDKAWVGLLSKLLPPAQLDGLATGSLATTLNRMKMLKFKDGRWESQFPQGLKVYNFAGEISLLLEEQGLFTRMALGILSEPHFEYDLVVDVGSANMDFLYHIEDENGEKAPEIGMTDAVSTYLPIQMAHVPAVKMAGLACVNNKDADSNPVNLVLQNIFQNYVRNTPVKSENLVGIAKDAMPPSLRRFNVEIKVSLPDRYQRKLPLTLSSVEMAYDRNEIEEVTITDSLINQFSGFNADLDNHASKDFQTFFHSGLLQQKYAIVPSQTNGSEPETKVIHYTIKLNGWQEKKFALKVAPGLSTYAEIYLEPVQPVAVIVSDTDESTLRKQFPESGGCYKGKLGQYLGIHKGQLFKEFLAEKEFLTLPDDEDTSVRILGRVGHQRMRSSSKRSGPTFVTDRYLVRLEKGEEAWMNAVDLDVDVSAKVKCPEKRN